MKILIDLQGAQGGSRHRGIGRYSMSLALAMIRNRGSHEIIIMLNGMFPESIEPIRAKFDGLIPQKNIVVWIAAGPVQPSDENNVDRRKTAEALRSAFIRKINADVLHITSLFEGFTDNAIHTITHSKNDPLVAVTFYDLIPLLQKEIYLPPNSSYSAFYLEKISFLKQADLFLAISNSSRQELINNLSINSEAVVNIGSATESHFKKISINEAYKKKLQSKFKIKKPFLMYSGATDERKNHLRLIKAFSLLPTALRQKYQLVIVGYLPPHHTEKFELHALLCGLNLNEVIITNQVSDDEMIAFYNLCALFVFPSWHEGFGLPALEAMSCGAPTIGANATSIPEVIGMPDALFDPFDENSIATKITHALEDNLFLKMLSEHGLDQAKKFSWDISGKKAIHALESLVQIRDGAIPATDDSNMESSDGMSTINLISKLDLKFLSNTDLIVTARSIFQNLFSNRINKLFVDISELAHRDHKTGIQRVVRSILIELIKNPPAGYQTELVYASPNVSGYRFANKFSKRFFNNFSDGLNTDDVQDDFIDVCNGDIFLGLDLQHHVVLRQGEFYSQMRRVGVSVYFVVYDLLPVLMPHAFPSGTPLYHGQWLEMLSRNDGAICISKAVADELKDWLTVYGPPRFHPLKIGWFHLGADVSKSFPTKGMPNNYHAVLSQLAKIPTFLSVGTIEPRKGQLQTLAAFEILWAKGININLVIIGKNGWNVELLVELLRNHKERDKRLFWLEGVSDEYLQKVYAISTCLIAASEGEGFGLPLIEAAQHCKPIIARDIPVFREVAGRYALYFSGLMPDALAEAVHEWLKLSMAGQVPQSNNMPWLTWKQSTQSLMDVILNGNWYQQWMPDDVHRFWGSDSRLFTQVGKRIGREIQSTAKAGYLILGPFIALAAGQYQVEIHGTLGSNGVARAIMDVVIDKGVVILAKCVLGEPNEDGSLVSLPMSLDSACTDLEVRVWVSDETDLRVSMITIEPSRADHYLLNAVTETKPTVGDSSDQDAVSATVGVFAEHPEASKDKTALESLPTALAVHTSLLPSLIVRSRSKANRKKKR